MRYNKRMILPQKGKKKGRKKMAKKISTLIIIIMIAISMTMSTFATSSTELKNQQSEIQSQIDDTQEELNQVKTEISSTMQEVQELDAQIAQSEAELEELNTQITNLEQEIETTKAELEEAQKKYDEQQILLQDRVVAQYKAGKTTYLDVLLKSKSLSDLISNYYLVSKITEWDTELLNQMQEEKQKIETAKTQLEEKESEYKIAKANKEKTNVVLKNNKALKSSYVSQLSEDEKNLQAEIDAKNEELARVSQEIKKIEQSSIIADADYDKYVGGTMAWPTRIGKYVTSVYAPGGRGDSSYAGTAHKGVDIRAPLGTAIYAAADGVVVYVNSSGYGGGWGLYVVISHGNGIYTRYAHGSSIPGNITVGTTVTTDTVIMYSGSTGASDAPHLHFEVCQGSIYNQVNPCSYLGISNKVGSV